MSDERTFYTAEEAEAMLPDGEKVHTFRGMIGADWPRERIVEVLRKHRPERSGPMARGMGHGLYVCDDLGPLFIQTRRGE